MPTVNYYKIGKRLSLRYPEIARQMLFDEPIQRDVAGQISAIYQQYNTIQRTVPGMVYGARLEFVAIVVRYADPEVFTTSKKLKSGVRSELAELFQCEPSQISHILKNIKDYLGIYKEFQNRVDKLYSEIFEP